MLGSFLFGPQKYEKSPHFIAKCGDFSFVSFSLVVQQGHLGRRRIPIRTDWNSEIERCPFAKFTFEPDLSALEFDKVLCNAQSKTGARGFSDLIIRGAEELTE